MAEKIRILIADDHAIVREGLRTLITRTPGFELVGEAANGVEVVVQAKLLDPDVILLDMVMPLKNGLEAIIEIKRDKPQARILVLTSFDDDERVFTAMKAGAMGYLLKDSTPDALVQAIYNVYHNQPCLSPEMAFKMIRELNRAPEPGAVEDPLTEREIDILRLIAQGLSNQEIAEKLVISERTVGKHVGNILEKLHLANRTQAALYALRQGLANLNGHSH